MIIIVDKKIMIVDSTITINVSFVIKEEATKANIHTYTAIFKLEIVIVEMTLMIVVSTIAMSLTGTVISGSNEITLEIPYTLLVRKDGKELICCC